MQIVIVRDAAHGCEPDCAEWIAAQGRIVPGTYAAFARVVATLGTRKLPVFLQSGGGSVPDALAMGRLIRAKGLDTAVAATFITPCGAQDQACQKGPTRGKWSSVLSTCASACVFVLAGGVQRFASPWTLLGVHQITNLETYVLRYYRTIRRTANGRVETERQLISVKPISTTFEKVPAGQKYYDQVRAYFVGMGVSDTIMPLLMSTPASDIHWLSPQERISTKIVTDLTAPVLVRAAASVAASSAEEHVTGSVAAMPPFASLDAGRLGSVGGHDFSLEFVFARPIGSNVHLGMRLLSDGQPIRSSQWILYLVLPSGKTIALMNSHDDDPMEPLTADMAASDFCNAQGVFQVRLESKTSGGPSTQSALSLGDLPWVSTARGTICSSLPARNAPAPRDEPTPLANAAAGRLGSVGGHDFSLEFAFARPSGSYVLLGLRLLSDGEPIRSSQWILYLVLPSGKTIALMNSHDDDPMEPLTAYVAASDFCNQGVSQVRLDSVTGGGPSTQSSLSLGDLPWVSTARGSICSSLPAARSAPALPEPTTPTGDLVPIGHFDGHDITLEIGYGRADIDGFVMISARPRSNGELTPPAPMIAYLMLPDGKTIALMNSHNDQPMAQLTGNLSIAAFCRAFGGTTTVRLEPAKGDIHTATFQFANLASLKPIHSRICSSAPDDLAASHAASGSQHTIDTERGSSAPSPMHPADRSIRVGAVGGYDLGLQFAFALPLGQNIELGMRVLADGKPIFSLPWSADLVLPGGKTVLLMNVRNDRPMAPLMSSIWNADICAATGRARVRLESSTGGTRTTTPFSDFSFDDFVGKDLAEACHHRFVPTRVQQSAGFNAPSP